MTIEKKQQFEDLIDAMMIEEVAGLDSELKTKLQGLPVDKKRIGILSILDKDRGLFMKIHNQINSTDFNKTDHIKNVVEMLREYVEVGSREQKEFGEVFTKYWTISEMLDLIPQEDWSNPNLKFLDSCAGAGNFPAVIIERLMTGLSEWEPDDEKRYRHIVENMIYMTELQAKNAFLILCALDPKDIYSLNIFNGSFLGEEFDNHRLNVWGVENFDYVIQNPPYQKMDGGNGASAQPLYNEFIDKSLLITNKLISIHPSRWMAAGKGLDSFRKKMLARTDIKFIKHFNDSQEVFGKCVNIEGGIQYIFIDKNYHGLVNYNNKEFVDLNQYDVFLEPKYYGLVNKFSSSETLDRICRTSSTYPIRTNDDRLTNDKMNEDDLVCYVSQQKGFKKYIRKEFVTRNQETISQIKVITARANGKKPKFGNKFIGYPNEICTDSYISFAVNNEDEAKSLISYMNTKFCNFFLSLRKNTQDIKPSTCKWIPIVPFDRLWNDEMLFEYFNLTEEEKDLILTR